MHIFVLHTGILNGGSQIGPCLRHVSKGCKLAHRFLHPTSQAQPISMKKLGLIWLFTKLHLFRPFVTRLGGVASTELNIEMREGLKN